MIHRPYPFEQWMSLKNVCIKHHAETHFEDPLKGDFFNYIPKKGLCLYLESSIRRGLHFFHHGLGGLMEGLILNRRRFLTPVGIGGLFFLSSQPEISFAQARKEEKMVYTAKDYSRLLGMEGFSETLLKNHFTLYQGYVTNTNKLMETLAQMLKEGKIGAPEFAELKRRFGWEFNGMRLHEYYFENLGGKGGLEKTSKLYKKISEDFGNYETWEKEFKAVGMMRGIGWAVLYQDLSTGRLINFWINEHDVGHPAGCTPILILDVFEHAFMIDYGLKRADYVEAFFKNIDWKAAEKRLG